MFFELEKNFKFATEQGLSILDVQNIDFSLYGCKSSYVLKFLSEQTYAPTTLAVARDFWTLRYTTSLPDGSLVVIPCVFSFCSFRRNNCLKFGQSQNCFCGQ